MTTKQIYDLAIKLGVKADIRGVEAVKKQLLKTKKKYNKLDSEAKSEFDLEELTNPYSDSRILFNNNKKIKKALAGIDMEGAEMLLAQQLGNVDLIITHHPLGSALAGLAGVIPMQAQIMADYGVPINIAESLTGLRASEVSRGLSPLNHHRQIDIAQALDLNYICIHAPADNLGANFLIKLLKKQEKKLETISDIIKLLKTIPEYQEAVRRKAGPMIFNGQADSSCGKSIAVEFVGGTSGSKEMYEKMAQSGINTIIGMHIGEEHLKEAKKYHLNVIIAGHIASDSLGMNLFLDEVEKQGVKIVPMSGLIRVKRFKK